MTLTIAAVVAEASRRLRHEIVFAKMLPPTRRVRRRGFRADVRRGDYVRLREQPGATVYCVVRRSARHLWLEEVRTPISGYGDTVRVRVPARYQP